MKLGFEDIKKITVGAVSIEEQADGIHFYKCTGKQLEAWKALSESFYPRALATTGIRLDFNTNSKRISFNAVSGYKFEIYVDGLFRKQYLVSEPNTPIHFDIKSVFGEDMDSARITVYLPAHAIGVISDFELDDGAYITPHVFDTKMLFFGDSITQGCDSDRDSLSYAQRVSRFFNANSVIHGVGGGYFDQTVFDRIELDPETVFIAFGTNDFSHYHTVDEVRRNACSFMDIIKREYNEAKNIFVISPIWRADFEKGKRGIDSLISCRQVIIEQAEAHGFIHIDGTSLVPPSPEFFADRSLHPNAVGFGIYAENLIRQIIRYM
ncbi:MAG: SGNH/GDSL hydrolase family protein [Clostridia bacterium]|nr:SGNH/GDSL hydrolase family protein [Clostridia bacterium]